MPVNFTGDPIWRETITGPANVDEITGPSVADMGVLLADRTMYLLSALQQTGSYLVPLCPGQLSDSTGTTWAWNGQVWVQADLTATDVVFEVDGSTLSELVSVSAYVKHPVGGHGGLPATMPKIAVNSLDVAAGSTASLGQTFDPSATVGAYEAYHAWTHTLASPAPFDGNRITIEIYGEASTNAIAGLELWAIEIAVQPIEET